MTDDAANVEPTFRDLIREALPPHTHHAPGFLSWSAQWTTPDGVWSLTCFGLSETVQIEGPDFSLHAARLKAEGVISLLLDAGAIEAPASQIGYVLRRIGVALGLDDPTEEPDDAAEDRVILTPLGEAAVSQTMHGYTDHGWACCELLVTSDKPALIAKCGGPNGWCKPCASDRDVFHAKPAS